MNFRSLAFALFSILLLAASVARAATIQTKTIEEESQDISVPLSKNRLEIQVAKEQEERERASRPKSSLEFAASTWEPNSLQPESRLSTTNSFGSTVPSLNVNTVTPFNRDLSLKAGFEFSELSRNASFNVSGLQSQDTQTVYLPAVRIGVEYAPVRYAGKLLKPFLSASVLPTAMITGRSAFDDGETDFGVAGEFAGGALIHAFDSFDVTAAVLGVVGKVKSSDLTGYGLSAGVRVPL